MKETWSKLRKETDIPLRPRDSPDIYIKIGNDENRHEAYKSCNHNTQMLRNNHYGTIKAHWRGMQIAEWLPFQHKHPDLPENPLDWSEPFLAAIALLAQETDGDMPRGHRVIEEIATQRYGSMNAHVSGEAIHQAYLKAHGENAVVNDEREKATEQRRQKWRKESNAAREAEAAEEELRRKTSYASSSLIRREAAQQDNRAQGPGSDLQEMDIDHNIVNDLNNFGFEQRGRIPAYGRPYVAGDQHPDPLYDHEYPQVFRGPQIAHHPPLPSFRTAERYVQQVPIRDSEQDIERVLNGMPVGQQLRSVQNRVIERHPDGTEVEYERTINLQ